MMIMSVIIGGVIGIHMSDYSDPFMWLSFVQIVIWETCRRNMQVLIPMWLISIRYYFATPLVLTTSLNGNMNTRIFNIDTSQLKYFHLRNFWRPGIDTTANISLLISFAVSVYSAASIVPNWCV